MITIVVGGVTVHIEVDCVVEQRDGALWLRKVVNTSQAFIDEFNLLNEAREEREASVVHIPAHTRPRPIGRPPGSLDKKPRPRGPGRIDTNNPDKMRRLIIKQLHQSEGDAMSQASLIRWVAGNVKSSSYQIIFMRRLLNEMKEEGLLITGTDRAGKPRWALSGHRDALNYSVNSQGKIEDITHLQAKETMDD